MLHWTMHTPHLSNMTRPPGCITVLTPMQETESHQGLRHAVEPQSEEKLELKKSQIFMLPAFWLGLSFNMPLLGNLRHCDNFDNLYKLMIPRSLSPAQGLLSSVSMNTSENLPIQEYCPWIKQSLGQSVSGKGASCVKVPTWYGWLSKALDVLQLKEEDVLKFLAAGTHLGGTNLDFQRKSDSIYIISLKRIWEKLLLAAHLLLPLKTLLIDPEEIEKEEQAAAEKTVTKEEFQSEWTTRAPDSTATQPEVADWSEGKQVPLWPFSRFRLKTTAFNLPWKNGLQLP
ncbi:uncharacterized protein LOC100989621 [Pan paniscus]|uniref:uncharacterized protein LOC100989621 n=1 Tax=Pan paniscus TaxID=9597 RepID=UPI003004585A